MKKRKIAGIYIDNLTMQETLERIGEFISSGGYHQHVVVNLHKIIMTSRDRELRDIINNCDLVNVDGMLLVWLAAIAGRPLKERVAGIDLFLSLIEASVKKGWKIYMLGAKMSTLEKALDTLGKRYPSLKIAGYRDGYWSEPEEADIIEDIRMSCPDILFVGISSPKKEYFLAKHINKIAVPFAMGVGGSFDVLAGVTTRAPLWMQKYGMEGFFRFLQEPRRLFARYILEFFYYPMLIVRELIR